jgi:hypothetical protein
VPHSSHQTSTDLLVLHALRCIGFAGLARIAEAAGLPESDVDSVLIDLARAGHVSRTPGDFGGWGLTESGRAADAVRIADELDTAGARTTVAQAYDDFLPLNRVLLDLCTAWQLRTIDGVARPNEHTDPAYDSRVLDLFTDFGHRADVVCAELSAALTRFERYRVRLTDALTRARSGELDYLVDRFDSYHTVWFQLHEDLLATLGIPRDWAAADR